MCVRVCEIVKKNKKRKSIRNSKKTRIYVSVCTQSQCCVLLPIAKPIFHFEQGKQNVFHIKFKAENIQISKNKSKNRTL